MFSKQSSSQVSILIVLGVIAAIAVGGTVLSPANAIQIMGFCTLIAVSLLALLKSETTSIKIEEAAKKVEEVKTDLAASDAKTLVQLNKMEETGEKTHTLVNSNMGVQLKLNAAVTKRLANMTQDKNDIEAAELAATMLTEHEKKQAIVDAGNNR